jgi:hypothetical protein
LQIGFIGIVEYGKGKPLLIGPFDSIHRTGCASAGQYCHAGKLLSAMSGTFMTESPVLLSRHGYA